jgi:shikimate 5-dehydrogenase
VNRTFVLVKVEKMSGRAATFYTLKFIDRKTNELEDFVLTYKDQFSDEVAEILTTIDAMAHRFGARENFFKEWEGRAGDGVCALYDMKGSKLRMYCIRYGKVAVVLGNGGHKAKTIRTLQQDARLTLTNRAMRDISVLIDERLRSKEIWWSGHELVGNLKFDFDDDED